MRRRKLLIAGAMLPAISACDRVRIGIPSHIPTALSVPTPIAMSKAGNLVVIDFQATPENVDLDETYMIKLAFDRVSGNDILGKLNGYGPEILTPLQIQLEKENGFNWSGMDIDDNSYFLSDVDMKKHPETPPQDKKTHIIHGFVYASQTARGLMEFGSFKFPGHGGYRAKIETVKDLPIFENIPCYVAVERHYPLGK